MENGGEVVFVKIGHATSVLGTEVLVQDVAEIYCRDEKIAAAIRKLVVLDKPQQEKQQRKKNMRIAVSAMRVVRVIQTAFSNVQVQLLGETDFIVEFKAKVKQQKNGAPSARQVLLVVLLSIFTLIGSMYAIMAYNNDVGTIELFTKVYDLFGAGAWKPMKILEGSYAVGLALGIIIFYNHFGGKRFSTDPAPVEVEMDKYAQDVDDTLIERAAKEGQEIL